MKEFDPSEYVSFETAQRLYNLDFGMDCLLAFYHHSWMDNPRLVQSYIAFEEQSNYDGTDVYFAPHLYQIQKWLRIEHKWHIIVEPNNYKGLNATEYSFRLYHPNRGYENWNQGSGFSSYESALSAGIDRALKVLEDEQQH